ncbi:BON domain-containing protein [Burkholderia ubonensis]|uniref:OsmY domain-containing protein n=1 Tax=Burkholderia ubonensis TaxID=101571 RepID=A0A119MT42_9BURK|nr:BON domain-containing protein [Burkholderia ubonensis]KWD88696.1 OsmY domain-containing protein [Burkholderia ubonensis]KWD92246.1 OsmY domain-containing protein [Burkholderia ubonensis]KWD96275.1 OsmY domain-containing protein [Burkholderia ubonensis]KWE10575.1 OsmY domain-containing protein [Burkholderia ubonensis]
MKSDATLKQHVEQELFWDPALHARRIDVDVRDRVVTLRGTVVSWAQKFAAQKAAQRVGGARALVLELAVAAPPSARADQELASAIMSAFKWQEALEDQPVRVEVDRGCVTLDGEVDWGYQRHAAETIVSRMAGVVGVANRIHVRAAHMASDVGGQIAAAFARRAQRESAAISVDAVDGIVTLSGTVDSLADRRAACGAVWSVKGVREVIDRLTVA